MDGYKVMVDDNFHYMDESERYELGIFATAEDAIAACRTLVDGSLAHLHEAGMTATELFDRYKSYGEDPFVAGPPEESRIAFSAWTYAKERAQAICNNAEPRDS